MKKLISNPNFIYIAAFIVPFLFYTLGWSNLYPKLRVNLFIFYLFTFIVCGILGTIILYVKPFTYTAIPVSNKNKTTIVTIFFLYLIEILYSRNIPLFSLFTGTFNYDESNFGIPVLHTFLISFNSFYCLYIFHQYISNQKKSLLYLFLITLLPFVFLINRSSIISVILGSFIIFLIGRQKISVKMAVRSFIGTIVVLYLFGYLGNLRSGHGDSTYIPRSSEATEAFLNGPVPNEFYWSYLYIASPVANLQNNIDNTIAPGGTFKQLIINECLPNFFTKFLPFLQVPGIGFYQINPFLNVGTTYVYSFSYAKWRGILFFFIYFIILVNLYYLLLLKSYTYKVTGLAILFNIIIFANFHNTISYSASSIQLLYPVLFSMLKNITFKKTSLATKKKYVC